MDKLRRRQIARAACCDDFTLEHRLTESSGESGCNPITRIACRRRRFHRKLHVAALAVKPARIASGALSIAMLCIASGSRYIATQSALQPRL
ncbi:hypothetical protein P0D88_22935 [Paraburkholderia sp. RL18-103-BIB-C]|jgi:hypothetical protein|uniref:hypothetical protein n=1 Tax=Paraburkholderia sp. RL18-103-BIB-C TaxID=3031637 RepID=UPI0038B80687